jgi:hypothetical protein
MVKESNELVTARAALKKAEEDLGDPGRLVHLRKAINSLFGVMLGDAAQIEKDIAKKLLMRSRNTVLSEVKAILANFESYEPGSLDHWNKVMEVFIGAGLHDDPEFKACKEQLLTRPGPQSIGTLKPADLDMLEKELQAVLNSLSTHRIQLSKIKWGMEK